MGAGGGILTRPVAPAAPDAAPGPSLGHAGLGTGSHPNRVSLLGARDYGGRASELRASGQRRVGAHACPPRPHVHGDRAPMRALWPGAAVGALRSRPLRLGTVNAGRGCAGATSVGSGLFCPRIDGWAPVVSGR